MEHEVECNRRHPGDEHVNWISYTDAPDMTVLTYLGAPRDARARQCFTSSVASASGAPPLCIERDSSAV